MPFAVGAAVRVISLQRIGDIVEAGRGGRYRVRVGGVVLSCREDDLQEAAATGHRRKQRADNAARPAREPGRAEAREKREHASASVDLHGLTVEEALRSVEHRLDTALRDGMDHLDIIHGRGSGRVKNAVHKFLKEVGAVRHFAVAQDNPGITRAYF
jgi:DNA mismatch repair protein MutS2